ncbi:MAG: LLM class flavin-dependent oxidoreductase [Actinobacteria bacterium]|nr:LLM class flavin-dependent oxidoreductase [Actinomycetota bacterium]MBW3650241.1 LLM class flavin-dependent oxidoreductase [Actinomycetota bacterium]
MATVGLALPQYDYSVPGTSRLAWSTVQEWAQRAEQLGFGSLWMADHLFLSIEKYGAAPGDHFGYDPIVGLAALARTTSRVQLGTLVLCAQLRPPKVLAHQLETLHDLAAGRFIAGVGAGWFEPEYRAAGIPFGSPALRLAQLVEVLEALAGGPTPRWVGGRGDRLLDVVAGHAEGWNAVWSWTPEAYLERLEVLERACERRDRDPSTVTRSLGLYALVGEDEADLHRRFRRLQELAPPGVVGATTLEEWRTGRLVGTVEQVREQAARWSSLGVSTLIAGLGALPFSVTDPDDLDLLASALL